MTLEYGHANNIVRWYQETKNYTEWENDKEGVHLEEFQAAILTLAVKQVTLGTLSLDRLEELIDPNDIYDENPFDRTDGWRE